MAGPASCLLLSWFDLELLLLLLLLVLLLLVY